MIALVFGMLMSQAGALGPQTLITSYECRITVIADDLLPNGVQSATLSRPVSAQGSHGGMPIELTMGEHKIGIVADAKWRGIIWQRAGKDVAQVLTAGVKPIEGNSVVILTNPANLQEAVHLVCDPLPGDFPAE